MMNDNKGSMESKKSWIERHLAAIVIMSALFLFKMCSDLSK